MPNPSYPAGIWHEIRGWFKVENASGAVVDSDNPLIFSRPDFPSVQPEDYSGHAFFKLKNVTMYSHPTNVILDDIVPIYALDDYGNEKVYVTDYKEYFTGFDVNWPGPFNTFYRYFKDPSQPDYDRDGYNNAPPVYPGPTYPGALPYPPGTVGPLLSTYSPVDTSGDLLYRAENEVEMEANFDDCTPVIIGPDTFYNIDEVWFYFPTNNVGEEEIQEIQNQSRARKYFWLTSELTPEKPPAIWEHNVVHPNPDIGIPVTRVKGLWHKYPTGTFATGDNLIGQNDIVQCRYNMINPIWTSYQTTNVSLFIDPNTYDVNHNVVGRMTWKMPHNINIFPMYAKLKVLRVKNNSVVPDVSAADPADFGPLEQQKVFYDINNPSVSSETPWYVIINDVETIFSTYKSKAYQFHNPQGDWSKMGLYQYDHPSAPIWDPYNPHGYGDTWNSTWYGVSSGILYDSNNPSRPLLDPDNPSKPIIPYPQYIKPDDISDETNWNDPEANQSIHIGTTGFTPINPAISASPPQPFDRDKRSIYCQTNCKDFVIRVNRHEALGFGFVNFLTPNLLNGDNLASYAPNINGVGTPIYIKTYPSVLETSGSAFTRFESFPDGLPKNTLSLSGAGNNIENVYRWGRPEADTVHSVTGTTNWGRLIGRPYTGSGPGTPGIQHPFAFPPLTLYDSAAAGGQAVCGASVDGGVLFLSLRRYHPFPYPYGKNNPYKLLWSAYPFYDHQLFGDVYRSFSITQDDNGQNPAVHPNPIAPDPWIQIDNAQLLLDVFQTINYERRIPTIISESGGIYELKESNCCVLVRNRLLKVTWIDTNTNKIRLNRTIEFVTGDKIHTALKTMFFIWNMNPNLVTGYIFKFRVKDGLDQPQNTSITGLNDPAFTNMKFLGCSELTPRIAGSRFGIHVKGHYELSV